MTTELTLHELEAELIAELPTREALSTYNWSAIFASNRATAFNYKASGSTATAYASQTIVVVQLRDINIVGNG